ncbi:hypothetical protein [Oryzomicrobium terrae]|uniref:hypothetical protein n=1 Tax=Oryzomicrobium terrae TaxID=1735038 RepID=UPI0011EEA534|nr:hypothetical protein [Oryzomicrobium terrae]
MIKGAGQAAADFVPGVSQDNALKQYGQSVIDANPTAVTSLGDIADKPGTAVKEAVGNAAGSMGGMLGARVLGQAITAAAPLTGPFAPATAIVGQGVSWLGPAAVAALPSFGGIREQQIKDDPSRENDLGAKARAAVGAAAVGAVESKFGPQEWAMSALTKEGRKKVTEKFAAKTLAGSVGKGLAKGAAVEGAEELAQNPIEQVAAYQDPTTAEKVKDTAFGGAMGAIGGGVMGGGFGAASRLAQPSEKQATPQQAQPLLGYKPDPLVAFPDGTVGRQADVDAYINGLPESQRTAARAKLYGQGAQPVDVPGNQVGAGEARQANYEARVRAAELAQQEAGETAVPQTTPPDGAAILSAKAAEQERARLAEQEANRSVSTPDDEIYQSVGIDNRSASQRLGLDPAAGPMSSAAALAVDSGAADHVAQQSAIAQAAEVAQGQGKESPGEKIGSSTGEITQGEEATTDPEAELVTRMEDVRSQARVSGWNQTLVFERNRIQSELAKLRSARVQAEAAKAQEPFGQSGSGIDLSGRTDAQLQYLTTNGQAGYREAAAAELARRQGKSPAGDQAPASNEGTAVAGAPDEAPPASVKEGIQRVRAKKAANAQVTAPAAPLPALPAATADSAEVAGLRAKLREVEGKVLAAAPAAMGQGGGDIEAALKSRKVPVTLKAQHKKLRDQLHAAIQAQGDAAPSTDAQVAPATAPKEPAIEGKDLGDGWAEFHKDTGTVGIPRAEMPQIRAEHRGAMTNFMNARGVQHQEETVPAASLKPTQAEFSRDKVARAKAHEGGDRSILISSDGHVLDGHHQWLAAREAGADVKAIRLDAPIRDLVKLAHEFPSSTTSTASEAAVPAKADATQAQPSELESLFERLGAKGRMRKVAEKEAADHPRAEQIKTVTTDFHDILIALMDAGKLEVNGHNSLTEDNKACL